VRARTVGVLAGLGAVAGVLVRRRRLGRRDTASQPHPRAIGEPSNRLLQGTAALPDELARLSDEVPDGWSVVEFDERGTQPR
jgi:hypothetical protein